MSGAENDWPFNANGEYRVSDGWLRGGVHEPWIEIADSRRISHEPSSIYVVGECSRTLPNEGGVEWHVVRLWYRSAMVARRDAGVKAGPRGVTITVEGREGYALAQLQLNTVTVECNRSGSGHPVVFVHGSASDHRTWHHQQAVFAQAFQTLTYSRRYHWPNPPIRAGEGYVMSQQVDDLIEILQLAGGRPHIIGHSYGAYLALMAAIQRPELVDRIVLAEPPVIPLLVGYPPKPIMILRLLVTRPVTAIQVIRFIATGLLPATRAAKRGRPERAFHHFGNAVLGKSAFAALSAERIDQVRANFTKEELLGDAAMMPLDADALTKVQSQTLLVAGAESPGLFHALIRRLAELMPAAHTVEIPHASHMMHEDNPERFNAAVLRFLE